MNLNAVITGDIVNSTKLRPEEHRKLVSALQKLMEPHKYEFYRGDSFQLVVKDGSKAMALILLCRATSIAISKATECDIRMSVGLGNAALPIKKLSTAQGEAFVLSGRVFDKLSDSSKRLAISIGGKGKEAFSIGFESIADYIDSIFNSMTAKQAEVIVELLKGRTQQEVVEKSGKSKSTISQFVSAGRWPEIEKLCNQFEKLVNLLR